MRCPQCFIEMEVVYESLDTVKVECGDKEMYRYEEKINHACRYCSPMELFSKLEERLRKGSKP